MGVNDLSKIKLHGRCFTEEVDLAPFSKDENDENAEKNKEARVSFVYGRNASGKSTIANAIKGKKHDEDSNLSSDIECSFLDENGNVLADEAEILRSTYIFDEAFIAKNVQVSDEGLPTIVMLGETGELTTEIKNKEGQRDELEANLRELDKKIQEAGDKKSELSPEYYRNNIMQALKGENNWSVRESKIFNKKVNTSVTQSFTDELIDMPLPTEPKNELYKELNDGIERISQLQQTESEELPPVPQLSPVLLNINEGKIVEALAKRLENPKLSPREEHILEVAKSFDGTKTLSVSREYFEDETHTTCPFCLREMSNGESKSLIEFVNKVLNDEVDKHAENLSLMHLPDIDINLAVFDCLNKATVNNCKTLVSHTQEIIDEYNRYLDEKLRNLYTPKSIQPLGLKNVIDELAKALETLSQERDQWNKVVANEKEAREKLSELNKELARHEIDGFVKPYKSAMYEQEELVEKQTNSKSKLESLKEEIHELESRKSNIKVALDELNTNLGFIFLDNKHIVLSGENGVYKLSSYGKPIKPEDVSAGERNAIALAYFFTNIGKDKSLQDRYSEEIFVILDDPISSFDQENRIGMLSYLRTEFCNILAGNNNSKILCMTHDGYAMQTFSEMQLSAVNSSNFKIRSKELKNGKLDKWDPANMGYTEMLKTMFKYSQKPDESMRPLIGNLTRRALEAFTTFRYNMGINRIVSTPQVLEDIDNECLKKYFQGRIFSIVLNSESHAENSAKIEGSINISPVYSSDTIDDVVRDVLVLIYCLDETHIVNQISQECQKERDKAKFIDQFEEWRGDILALSK